MRNVKIMMLMMAACLAGCSSDDEPQNPVTQNTESKKTETQKTETPRLMYVDVMDAPEGGDAAAPLLASHRAGAPITTATLSSFYMNYESNQYGFTKNGTWSTNYWPSVGDNTKIDFYAYTAGTFNYNSGNPYVAFTVEETVDHQHDLLVAEHKNISRNDDEGHVSLCFDHACAAVLFTVQITNTLHTKLKGNLTVKSIVLKNVIKTGDYYYNTGNTGAWTINDINENYADYTVTTGNITVTTTPQTVAQGYLYMIPQKRSASGTSGTYLDITYIKGSEDQHATIPLSIDWKAGQYYPINIKLGTTLIELPS